MVPRKGARDRDALLLAARQLLRIVRQPRRKPDAREPLARARRSIARPGKLERQHHVLQRGQGGQQLERLEDEAEPAPPQRRASILRQAVERRVAEPDFPRARTIQTREQAEQGRLARSGGTHHGHRRTRAHLKAHVLEDAQRRIAAEHGLAEVASANDGIGHAGAALRVGPGQEMGPQAVNASPQLVFRVR